jgi:hypothetical protein
MVLYTKDADRLKLRHFAAIVVLFMLIHQTFADKHLQRHSGSRCLISASGRSILITGSLGGRTSLGTSSSTAQRCVMRGTRSSDGGRGTFSWSCPNKNLPAKRAKSAKKEADVKFPSFGKGGVAAASTDGWFVSFSSIRNPQTQIYKEYSGLTDLTCN